MITETNNSADVAAQSPDSSTHAVRNWLRSERIVRALRGSAWSIAGFAATQLLRTITTLLLARLFLGPDAFGLIGLVGVFLAGLSMFSELGIVANVVQHSRGDDPAFLKTVYSIQAARGAVIWLVSVAAAYPLALLYHQPEIMPLLTVAAFSEAIRGLASTSVCTLTRHLNLSRITLLTVAAEVVGFVACLAWAMITPSAWALVARTIATALAYAAGSHFIAKQRIGFGWDATAAKDTLHFGGWVSLATATYFLGGQGERLILGKFVSPAELGCFSLAVMISSLPTGAMGQLINQTLLPIMSADMRGGGGNVATSFARLRRIFGALALVAALCFLFGARPFVNLLLGQKYAMTGWMLQILGLRVALDLFAAPCSSLMMARGKTEFSAAANTTRLVAMIAGLWISFSYFGVREAILSLILAQALSYIPLISGAAKLMPEVVLPEIKWYAAFVGSLALLSLPQWLLLNHTLGGLLRWN